MKPAGFPLIAALAFVIAGCEQPVARTEVKQSSAASPEAVVERRQAPQFEVESVSQPGKMVSLAKLKGEVVMLEFWATWCGPCKAFAPTIQKLHEKYSDKGLRIVSVSDEDRKTVEGYAKEREQEYPLYLDAKGATGIAYKIESIPHTLIIDRTGRVVLEDSQDERILSSAIEKALNEKPSS